jgi:tellurite resistance protein TerC
MFGVFESCLRKILIFSRWHRRQNPGHSNTSVPAIFAITTDSFIVHTNHTFASRGLRGLYLALASMTHRFGHLKYALVLVRWLLSSKILRYGIIRKMAVVIALGLALVLVTAGVLVSLAKMRGQQSAGESR